ncbi:helicase-associated domain-containing protein [Actinosynnema sp. NPDC047251]|uniref:helicase-associated domain-containing protein n=1 Tax=Saccharothrix espanaensis TaxID=103731 RepID=UPI0002FEEAAC|nr:helicase-associated domain-containing protein [Saccharothrix espanaensis]
MGRKSALAGWLHELDAQDIRDILALRKDAADTHPHSLRGLADELTAPASLKRAVDGLDRACRDVLDAVLRLGADASPDSVAETLRCNGKSSRAELRRALERLRAHALVWPAGDRLRAATGLRPAEGDPPRRITPPPRAPRRTGQHKGFADRAAIHPATSTVDGITRLVELCDNDVVTTRGGVGVRELRRIAGALRADETRTRLWLELAVEARLLAVADQDRRVLPTTRSDDWRGASPADRLAALAGAWPRMTWTPAKPRPALAEQSSEHGDTTRRGVLEQYAGLAEDEAFEHRHEVVAELVWARPAAHSPQATEAALVEAETIGLVALGALTALGRAVLTGDESRAAAGFVPPAADRAHLRPDLTAVAAGLPGRELSAALDLVADPAAGGWRFTGASVRRALDAGHTPDEVLARLAEVAEHGVPQTLERLVREVARRHGQVTVTAVACCVRADDPNLVGEIVRHRSLAALDLHRLGPTVLASARPADETLALLRAAGYAPAAAGPDGSPVVERVPRRRVEPAGRKIGSWRPWRAPLTDQELNRLALALVERERPRPKLVPPRAESRRMGAVRLLRDQSLVLRDTEVVLLAEALVTGTSVEIDVACGPRATSRHVITPVDHAAGNLTAKDETGESHEFPVGHIRSVRQPRTPVTPPARIR